MTSLQQKTCYLQTSHLAGWANARIMDVKILSCIPANLRSHADKFVQLVAALVKVQFPPIKEYNEGAQVYATVVGW